MEVGVRAARHWLQLVEAYGGLEGLMLPPDALPKMNFLRQVCQHQQLIV